MCTSTFDCSKSSRRCSKRTVANFNIDNGACCIKRFASSAALTDRLRFLRPYTLPCDIDYRRPFKRTAATPFSTTWQQGQHTNGRLIAVVFPAAATLSTSSAQSEVLILDSNISQSPWVQVVGRRGERPALSLCALTVYDWPSVLAEYQVYLQTRDFAPSTTASDGSTPPFACSTTKSTRSAHAGIRRNAPDDPGTSLVTTKVPAHKLRKPVWTLLRAKYQRLKAQKNRSPGEDAPSVHPKLGQIKHLRRPVTGAGTRGADGGSSSQVLMMSSAFEMDTAPPLNVTQTGPPLLSQTPEASQAPATTPLPSEAQINSQQMNQRSNPPKQQNARPQQRLAKCSTIVVKFDGYIDITRLNFSAVCQGILYAVQATPTEKEDTYIKRREKQNLIVVQTYRATISSQAHEQYKHHCW
ncbi:hypothetical protein HPB50_014360 [Hyalomma asiaticum]|uniref:Uncharacterized protein n=1 Tax=Hyalomma asiaticum TaxID=266040 RepID=A0ACB7RR07_HYAAI|nr:hypothetical protein HPB50_014360 [Hyalomma asiaticum]